MIQHFDKDRENNSVIQHYLGMTMNQMRHLEVSRLVDQKNINRIADFGCSQGTLLQRLARSQTIELLIGIDIDDSAVEETVSNLFPQNLQESIQLCREKDQNIYVYKGDISKKYQKIKQFQVELITLVDVIEHLLPQFIQSTLPKYCFISTPNQQFNQHFNIQKGKFRHWDHKFEWTQAQFQQFCNQVSNKYPYSYQIKGIGPHITDQTKGFCTQYAIFTRNQDIAQQKYQKMQIQSICAEPQERGRYVNKSWRNNKPNIMLNLLYKSLFYKQAISWEQARLFMEKESFAQCLQRSNIPINKQFFKEYLCLFSDRFDWDQEKYMLKQRQQSSSQSEECQERMKFEVTDQFQQYSSGFFQWS